MTLFFLAPLANANEDTLKVNTLKSLYKNCVAYEVNRDSDSCYEALYKVSSPELKLALILASGFEAQEGMLCTDINLWDSVDPIFDTQITFTNMHDGRVLTRFGYGGKVSYSLSCNHHSCMVTDIFNRNDISFVQDANQNCYP